MALNEYMQPNINQHETETRVHSYDPINFQFLGGVLEKKQQAEDQGELYSTTLLNNVKADSIIKPHRDWVDERKQYYNDRTQQIMDESGGSYANAVPKLQQLGRELQSDLETGKLAVATNTAKNYHDQLANINEIAKRSGINQDDAIKHLNQQTFGVYALDPEQYNNTLSTYQHGERIKFNDILDKAVGNIKVDGYQKYDMSDPNYMTKFGAEYLTDAKVRSSLQSTLKQQPGIRYEAMLATGAASPEDVTDEQLTQFIDNKVQGTVKGAVFSKGTVDKNETTTGKLAATREFEENTPTGGVLHIQKYPNQTGVNADEALANYNSINTNTKASIQSAYAATGLGPNTIITTGKNGDFKLSDLNDAGLAPSILKAIQEGDFTIKGADKSVADKFRGVLAPVLAKNDAVNLRIQESINKVAKDNFVPGVTVGENVRVQGKATPTIEIDKNTYNKLVRSQLTGEKFGEAYVNDSGLWVIKGKVYNPNVGGAKGKLFKDQNMRYDKNTINDQFKANLDNTGEEDVKVQYSSNMGNVNTASGPVKTNAMFNEMSNNIIANSSMLMYNNPNDPYNKEANSMDRKSAISAALAKNGVSGGIKEIVPIPNKGSEKGVQYSNTPSNGMQTAMQKFKVTLEDGSVEDVNLILNLNNQVTGTALTTKENVREWQLNAALQALKGGGNKVPLKDNGGNTIAILDNSNNMVTYVGEDGENSTTLEEYIKNPLYENQIIKNHTPY